MNKKYWKPFIALLLCVTLSLSMSPFVLANGTSGSGDTETSSGGSESESTDSGEAAIDRDTAIRKAEEAIPTPEGFSLESSNYHSSNRWNSSGSWRLEFVKKEGQERLGSISYTIDASTGEMMSYRYWSPQTEEPTFPPEVSKEEAQEIAQSFIAKVVPEKQEEVTLDPFSRDDDLPMIDSRRNYSFQFVRTHQGIPFPQNFLRVEVTTEGEIRHFDRRWDDDIIFPEVGSLISAEEALAQFEQAGRNQLQLQYTFLRHGREEQAHIAYEWNERIKNRVAYIDAQSGKGLNRRLEETLAEEITYEPVASEIGRPHFQNLKEELTEKQALEHVTQQLNINLEKFEVESSSYSSREDNRNEWRFSFREKEGSDKDDVWISVSVDTYSGQINHYSYRDSSLYSSEKEGQENFTREQLLEKAVGVIKQLAPASAHEYYFVREQETEEDYRRGDRLVNFQFYRKIHGILDDSNRISVAMDQETGEVIRFYTRSFGNREYPQPGELVTQEEALQKLLSRYQLTLQYQLKQSLHHEPYPSQEEEQGEPRQVKLVFDLRPPVTQEPIFLHAETGQFHSRSTGEVIQFDRVSPTDIDEHWAEEALMLMFQYNALDTDEQGYVRPNEKIKRGEMIKMFVLALNRGRFSHHYGVERSATFNDVGFKSPYFQYVEQAADMNIISNEKSASFNPEETLTREEVAVMIVKALGYDKIATHGELFQVHVEDRNELTHVGHVAIVTYLGILTPQNGEFSPDRQVTRAEAATVFYRFLQKRGEITESSGRYRW